MDKKTREFVIFSVIVMAIFGVLVRGVLLAPKQPADGPILVSHDLSERYVKNCSICHRKEIPWHEETFGYFDNCMNCHGGAPKTPHPTSGAGYANCLLTCHEEIAPSHDMMFPKTVTYQNCVGCHPGL